MIQTSVTGATRRPLFIERTWGTMMRALFAVALILVLSSAALADEPRPFPGTVSRWNGFVRHDFRVDGADVIVVEPEKPLPGGGHGPGGASSSGPSRTPT